MAKHISDLSASTALSGGELIEISQTSPTVKITAATISAASGDNSFNDSANGFATAGFAVGDRVQVTGFATNAANNALPAVIVSVVAGKIVVSGAALVTEAAGASVTIAKLTTVRTTVDQLVQRGPFADFAVKITPAALAADANDYNPAGLSAASRVRLSSSAAVAITGLAGGTDGRVVVLSNVGANTITLKSANAGSTAANRFQFTADVALAADAAIMLVYDATASRWRALGSASGSSGGGSGGTSAGIKGITLLRKTANQAISANTWTAVTFDANDYDNLGGYTAGATIWTVPAGCFFMRVNAKLAWGNNGGNKYINIVGVSVTSGSTTFVAGDIATRVNESFNTIQSTWVPVVPGDTYKIEVNTSIASSVSGPETNFGGQSRLEIEWAAALGDLIGAIGGGSGGLTLISSNTLAAAAASVTFASIPGTYADLILRINGRGVAAALTEDMNIAINGDTTLANYQVQQGQANSSSVSALSNPAGMNRHIGSVMAASATAGEAGYVELVFPNYAGTTFRKSYNGLNGLGAYPLIKNVAGRWANTAAIASLAISLNSGNNFAIGSDFRLYGRA